MGGGEQKCPLGKNTGRRGWGSSSTDFAAEFSVLSETQSISQFLPENFFKRKMILFSPLCSKEMYLLFFMFVGSI